MSSEARSLAATSGKEPPHDKKMKKQSPATEPTPISILSLPEDLLINCLSRVSRLYHPVLRRVSKRFRATVSSPELYATRWRQNRAEKCIYLYIRYPLDPKTYWLTLSRLPSRNTANGSTGYEVEQIPCPNYLRPAQSSTLVSVGSDVYKIGGANHLHECKIWKRNYCVSVCVLDCRTHTWRQAPSMGLARNANSTATLFDGKIYVAGGCDEDYVSKPNWIEAFDLETQTWAPVTNPRIFWLHEEDRVKGFEAKLVTLEGKLYIFGDESAVYNPEEDKWSELGRDVSRMFWAASKCHCVIDDVLFLWDKHSRVFKWYDSKSDSWKDLIGIEGLPELSPDPRVCRVEMVDLGGKIGFLWSEYLYTSTNQECRIWCAEITFERRDGDEMSGKVEWSDFVLRTHESCSSFNVVSASV
ncbi:putative F-box/kelch-repeat protein [Raphanus sativus]|uniref:F-box/kelch-repeat protein At1g61540 n=1 Tax=Raphanus sativus TaxID=3726 RepID=A0A6J0KG06_RAPSA|nr:putative F-box/kelch-repeat protein At1g61540 [Raphanus sativus]KAJ4885188.1 putative F-box/kelch-repeat protein [Raphanus sativus]